MSDGDNRAKPQGFPNLLEVTIKAGDAALMIRAVWINLSCPEREEQRAETIRLAGLASQKSGEVHRHLEQALNDREQSRTADSGAGDCGDGGGSFPQGS